jgi:hexosaminidase
MRSTILISLFCFSVLPGFSQQKEKPISVLPEPVSIVRGTGNFTLPAVITVSIPNLPELKTTTESILGKLAATGKKVSLVKSKSASIGFELTKVHDMELHEEGYRLSVKPSGIVITANKPAGLFMARKPYGSCFRRKLRAVQQSMA